MKQRIKKQAVKKKYLTASFFSCKIGKVIVMEEILKQTLLYDFYGELLTEHQKQVYEGCDPQRLFAQ